MSTDQTPSKEELKPNDRARQWSERPSTRSVAGSTSRLAPRNGHDPCPRPCLSGSRRLRSPGSASGRAATWMTAVTREKSARSPTSRRRLGEQRRRWPRRWPARSNRSGSAPHPPTRPTCSEGARARSTGGRRSSQCPRIGRLVPSSLSRLQSSAAGHGRSSGLDRRERRPRPRTPALAITWAAVSALRPFAPSEFTGSHRQLAHPTAPDASDANARQATWTVMSWGDVWMRPRRKPRLANSARETCGVAPAGLPQGTRPGLASISPSSICTRVATPTTSSAA